MIYTARHVVVKSGKVCTPTNPVPDVDDWDIYANESRIKDFLSSCIEAEDQERAKEMLLETLIGGPNVSVPFKNLVKENHPYEVPEYRFEVKKQWRSEATKNGILAMKATDRWHSMNEDDNCPDKEYRTVAVIVEPVKEDNPVMKSTKEILAEYGLVSGNINKVELAKENVEIQKRIEAFRRESLPDFVSEINLTKILNDPAMTNAFKYELSKCNGNVSKAIWYTLRDAPTNKYLVEEKEESQELAKLEREIAEVINRNGVDNELNTPDFKIAKAVVDFIYTQYRKQ